MGWKMSGIAKKAREPKNFNLRAYISGIQRIHETETQKAIIITEAHHEKWKMGGPL